MPTKKYHKEEAKKIDDFLVGGKLIISEENACQRSSSSGVLRDFRVYEVKKPYEIAYITASDYHGVYKSIIIGSQEKINQLEKVAGIN